MRIEETKIMKCIPVHCPICNTDFDLLEDDYGYMGTCNCTDVPTDPELEDTIPEMVDERDYWDGKL